ncbi:MAG: TlpA family protein disulfide reductase [Alphaproteobacteria bacterium]
MALWVVALAALLSYGIVSLILSHRDASRGDIAENQSVTALPAAVFYEASGKKVTLDDFKGQPVLVNLWATWCPPCVGELPSLDKLQAKLKSSGLVVLAISLDRGEDMTAITQFLGKHRIEHLTPYWDKDHEVRDQWESENLPVTWFISRDRKLRMKFEGPYAWDQGKMLKTIQGLVKPAP